MQFAVNDKCFEVILASFFYKKAPLPKISLQEILLYVLINSIILDEPSKATYGKLLIIFRNS
jgi:hypothetical protein